MGLLPLVLGLRAAWMVWREHRAGGAGGDEPDAAKKGAGVLQVATVTFANGGDNVGVYVPAGRQLGDVVLDGELVAFREGRLDFASLTSRPRSGPRPG